MKVRNIHECELEADLLQIGALIDSLSSGGDRLWPRKFWPRMKFDRPLSIGANGGHGPIRYIVEEYAPGKSVKFKFTGPKGFDGYHGYDLVIGDNQEVILRETLEMKTHGPAILTWPLIYKPMHNALIEDSLSMAQFSLGLPAKIQPWSIWVKVLRWIISGGKAHPQYFERV